MCGILVQLNCVYHMEMVGLLDCDSSSLCVFDHSFAYRSIIEPSMAPAAIFPLLRSICSLCRISEACRPKAKPFIQYSPVWASGNIKPKKKYIIYAKHLCNLSSKHDIACRLIHTNNISFSFSFSLSLSFAHTPFIIAD